MQLSKGKIKSKDLAQWFGMSYDSYRHKKVDKLEELRLYADFEEIYGGVIIKDIYQSNYIKNMKEIDSENYKNEVQNANQNISTISGMSEKFLLEDKPEYKGLSDSQIRKRLTRAGNYCFGITKDENSEGRYGKREYQWVVKLDGVNNYRELTEKEHNDFLELIQDKLSINTKEDAERIAKLASLDEKFEKTDMSKEEYLEEKKEILKKKNFFHVIQAFKVKYGLTLVDGTKHILKKCAWEED